MTTKKFWCHYIGNDGNTPKRRSIELTDIHELLPSISNEGAKTPCGLSVKSRTGAIALKSYTTCMYS